MRKTIIGMVCLFLSITWLSAQPSSSFDGEFSVLKGTLNATHSRLIWIGPNANITIDGTWMIFAEYVYVHPSAKISGKGLIEIRNPKDAVRGVKRKATKIDASHVRIDVDLELDNPNNLVLVNLDTNETDFDWTGDDFQDQDMVIGKNLNLNVDDAHVILGEDNLVFGENATLENYNHNRYLVCDKSGQIIKENLDGAFDFAIGQHEGTGIFTDYTPARLENNGVPDDFSVSVRDAVLSAENVEGMGKEWLISEATPGGSDVLLSLQHNKKTNNSLYDEDQALITKYVGISPNKAGDDVSFSDWDYSSFDCQSEQSGDISSTGATPDSRKLSRNFSDFTEYNIYTKSTCNASPLSIQWQYIEVQSSDCQNELTWGYATENGSHYFEVFRSYDNENFLKIAEFSATLSNDLNQNYSFIDHGAESRVTYYKVVAVYPNSNSESQVVQVLTTCNSTTSFLWPNPAGPGSTINVKYIAESQEPVQFYLIDALGQILYKYDMVLKPEQTVYQLDLSVVPLAKAVYILEIIDGSKKSSLKLIVD